MAISYYGKGDHPAGFVGFRVVRAFGDKYLQKYFSTTTADLQDESDDYFRLQKMRAQRQDLDWEIESLDYQYTQFVTKDHPNAGEHSGVGVHALTLKIGNEGSYWRIGFAVSKAQSDGENRKGAKLFGFSTDLYSEAWEKAVRYWAKEHGIRRSDRDRLLSSPPPAEQFKQLRQRMNNEGCNIPVSVLSSVFREQRERLARERALSHPVKLARPVVAAPDGKSAIEEEVCAWFEEALAVGP